MGKVTKIAWTATVGPDGSVIPGATFNPWVGCVRVSEGCRFCYAEAQAHRYGRDVWGPNKPRRVTSESYWKQPFKWDRQARTDVSPHKVFCGSMCDVFEDHPDLVEPRRRLWDMIEVTPWLNWQLLTKRPENIARMLDQRWLEQPLANVWIGTTAENQEMADRRIPLLLQVPAAVRFVSVEPMLSAVSLQSLRGTNWTIIGTESGPHRRPMKLEWARNLAQECQEAGVACFIKQIEIGGQVSHDPAEWPDDLRAQEFPA